MRKKIFNVISKEKIVDKLLYQTTLFVIIGIICFAIDAAFLAFFVELFHLNITVATIIAFLIATSVNYVLSVKYIFINGKFTKIWEIQGFFLISAISLGLNVLLMNIFVIDFKIWYLTAKLVTTMLVTVFTFSTKKWILFIK